MMNKWTHVISEVDNWIWLGAAALLVGLGAYFNVAELKALGLACLVKVKGPSESK
jgi:hypothetical protein